MCPPLRRSGGGGESAIAETPQTSVQPAGDKPAVIISSGDSIASVEGEKRRKRMNSATGSTFNLGGPSTGSAGDSGFAPIARVTLGQ